MYQRVSKYTSVFMYLRTLYTCCVLAYLRNAIVSREPVAHTLWNCRCIQQFILNTKSYQSIKHLCLAVSTTLHFKFICVCTRYSINPFSVIQRTCNTHIVKLQMHPNFMLKTSSSWFDCGVTHQIRHTLSLRVQVDLIVVLHIRSDTLYLYSKYGDVSLYQNVSDTSFPNHPAMIVEAKCARGNVSLCCLSKTHHHSLHLGSWIFFFLFFITSIKVTIRELVDVQICDQVSHHCNAMTLAIWRSTWGDEFSNMTIRTRFHPYYVTNYTFESWVNNLINLYPQPAMSSSCVSHFPWNCYGPDN